MSSDNHEDEVKVEMMDSIEDPEFLLDLDEVSEESETKEEQTVSVEIEEETNKEFYEEPSAILDFDCLIPGSKLDESLPSLDAPNYILAKFLQIAERNDSAFEELIKTNKEIKDLLENSMSFYTPQGDGSERLCDKDSEFRQGVSLHSGLKNIESVRMKPGSGELRGEAALLKMSNLLGIGEVCNIPLPHTGIWVTMKPPSEKEIIDLYNSIFKDRVELGRNTSGYIFNNLTVHTNNVLFQFILKHIYAINNKSVSKENFAEKLNLLDYPILLHGLSRVMYPNGFNYRRQCIENPSECSNIVEGKINLSNLYWCDNRSLTETQLEILSEVRPNSLEEKDYIKYRDEHTRLRSQVVTTSNGLKFKLRVPSFSEHITDGLKWVNNISNQVEMSLLSTDASEDEKIDALNQYVSASVLRQYNFYVEEIYFTTGETVKERKTIDETLGLLSSDDTTREELVKLINKFKNDSVIATIGIPEFICPSCQKEQETVKGTKVGVIPLDVLSTFFLTITSRMTKILVREK